MLSVMISFVSAMGGNVVNSYDPAIVKEWLNSYPYLYKGFTVNKGQIATMDGKVAKDVIFYSRNGNMSIFITENGLSYVIYDVEKKEVSKDNKELSLPINEEPENSILHYARIDYELIGSKIKKENIIYQDELPGYENFYLAHCPDGILFVKSYRKVIIKDIYPGINWIFRYDDNGNFHHEFELKNPQLISQIKLKVKYADIELADNGKSIILSTPIGKIKDGNLIGYQGNNIVEVSYRLIDNNLIAFDVKSFDKNKSLLIDPHALIWSTYYGGSGGDMGGIIVGEGGSAVGYDIRPSNLTIDVSGNLFVLGSSFSIDFPTYNPGGNTYYQGTCASCSTYSDIFILKFTNSGVRLWATYYGGNDYDHVYSITTDANGNIFVTGNTWSTDFPTYNPGGGAYYDNTNDNGDAFILKFTNSGVRLWATYYGGSSWDDGYSITTDANGNVFVTGYTLSTDFPTQNPGGAYFQGSNAGGFDAFILKFTNSGLLLWATYYGGSGGDVAFSSITDMNGNLFVVGQTFSSNFPTYNPGGGAYFDNTCGTDGNCNPDAQNLKYRDAFILKFNNSGALLWATYFGGSLEDVARSVKVDINGNIYIIGTTNSTDFPTQNPGGGAYFQGSNAGGFDAFILKFTNLGSLLWATYYGGSGSDNALAPNTANSFVATDNTGNVYFSGITNSNDFPTQYLSGAYNQSNNAGYYDAFILKFSSSGQRLWATYYGGNSLEYVCAISVDASRNIFITGYTSSTNLPTQNPGGGAYYQGTCNGCINYPDAFISKFDSSASVSLSEILIYTKSKLALNLFNLSTPIIIKLYSLDGKLVYSNTFKTDNIEINLKSLKSGIYILKAYSKDNKQLTYKFIKN
ncbi:MAG: SBBP repeat-containing protein [candidate division WOR-3 bacterium]